jgi:tetratricopeptide (TPR) repeat protein
MACYRAARQRERDAYVCDLAVQMARDGASRQALASALTNRALILSSDGRLEPALVDLDEALTQTPDDPAVHGNRGNLLLRLNRPAEALAAHTRAVDLAPDDPRGYYNRAFSYRALGDPARAEHEVAAVRSLLARRQTSFRDAETPARDAVRGR